MTGNISPTRATPNRQSSSHTVSHRPSATDAPIDSFESTTPLIVNNRPPSITLTAAPSEPAKKSLWKKICALLERFWKALTNATTTDSTKNINELRKIQESMMSMLFSATNVHEVDEVEVNFRAYKTRYNAYPQGRKMATQMSHEIQNKMHQLESDY